MNLDSKHVGKHGKSKISGLYILNNKLFIYYLLIINSRNKEKKAVTILTQESFTASFFGGMALIVAVGLGFTISSIIKHFPGTEKQTDK